MSENRKYRICSKVTVDENDHSVAFDGQRFPFCISEDGIEIHNLGTVGFLPSLTFTVLAESIEVVPKIVPIDKQMQNVAGKIWTPENLPPNLNT